MLFLIHEGCSSASGAADLHVLIIHNLTYFNAQNFSLSDALNSLFMHRKSFCNYGF